METKTKNHVKIRFKEPKSKTVFGAELRKARKKKYPTQVSAATTVNFSPDTISEHEKGESTPDAYTAIHYAMSYGSPALVMHYCDECPISKLLRLKVSANSLPQKAINFELQARKLVKRIKPFLEVARDDEVGDNEQKKFKKTLEA